MTTNKNRGKGNRASTADGRSGNSIGEKKGGRGVSPKKPDKVRRGEWGNEKARAENSGRWRGSGVEGWEVGDPPRWGGGGGGIWGNGGWW